MLRKRVACIFLHAILVVTPATVLAHEETAPIAAPMTESEWRAAARLWSLGVAERAQAEYQLGPVRMGLEGRVEARFRVTDTGATDDCVIVRSSGAAELDALVCAAIAASGPAPIKLGDNGIAEAVWAVLPVAFVLE